MQPGSIMKIICLYFLILVLVLLTNNKDLPLIPFFSPVIKRVLTYFNDTVGACLGCLIHVMEIIMYVSKDDKMNADPALCSPLHC